MAKMVNLPFTHCLCVLFFLLWSSQTLSEVYRWTDQNGRTHFGDRPPEQGVAKDISDTLDKINISSDYSTPEMMLRHAQDRDAERQKRLELWQEKQKNTPTQSERCSKARKQLEIIKGPVVFIDDNGKDLKISEATRKQRVSDLEKLIQKHCQ